jgi:peptidoglycan/xylan/chitin deacetylase (PgdA/CDA1 family)
MMATGRLLMFWDYDTAWGTDADRRRGLPELAAGGRLEFECTDRLLELHAEYDVPACFAVVGAAALPGSRPYHDPEQIRRIHAAGHEIASHGFAHEWVPALDTAALHEMLVRSRSALEQCIGAAVTTFVPPYNQPFDYAAGLSFSRSERRLVPRGRTDLGILCRALAATGYDFCRVAYRPWPLRAADRLARRRVDRPGRLERIGGIACARLNTPGGFADETVAVVERAARTGGMAVVYGHPHSLHAGNAQDERWLRPFLDRVRRLRADRGLEIVLPRALHAGEAARA